AAMGLILRWGLGLGLAIALADAVAAEVALSVNDVDLNAAIVLVDELISLTLYGLAGYRVGGALGEMRSGLEAAVLAGLVAGCAAVVYQLVRGTEPLTTAQSVESLALNVVMAAAAGALCAWVASTRRPSPPGR